MKIGINITPETAVEVLEFETFDYRSMGSAVGGSIENVAVGPNYRNKFIFTVNADSLFDPNLQRNYIAEMLLGRSYGMPLEEMNLEKPEILIKGNLLITGPVDEEENLTSLDSDAIDFLSDELESLKPTLFLLYS